MLEMANVASERVTQELNVYKNVVIDAGTIARLADPNQFIQTKKDIVNQRAVDHSFLQGNIVLSDGISIFDGNDYSDKEYFQKAIKG